MSDTMRMIVPDDLDVFHRIARRYSYTHPTMHLGRGCPDDLPSDRFREGITSGAAWYIVRGWQIVYVQS